MDQYLQCEVVSCPLCNSAEFQEVARYLDWTYGVPGLFHAVRCARCQHVFQNPRPTSQTMLAAYPADYSPHLGSVDTEALDKTSLEDDALHQGLGSPVPHKAKWKTLPPIAVLRKAWHHWLDDRSTWVPDRHDLSLLSESNSLESLEGLEVGCGSGWFSQHLQKDGWRMKAIEPSSSAAERAHAQGVDVWCGSLQNYESSPERFHAVFSWMVLEHLPFPQDALKAFHQWLKPNGILVFSVPNHASLDRLLFRRFWVGYDGPRHFQHFEPKRLKQLLSDSGFEEVQIIHQPNLQYWFGSLKAVQMKLLSCCFSKQEFQSQIRSQSARSGWLMRQYHNGLSFPLRVFLSPIAQLLSCLRLSGRLTVIARKR
jgi:SAM-dependent methyltransferase